MAMTNIGNVASIEKFTLASAKSASGDGGSISWNSDWREVGIYVEWSAGVTAGVVTIEVASSQDYVGTWASLATINWVAASKVDIVNITGVFGAIRARISTAIVGGTINVIAVVA